MNLSFAACKEGFFFLPHLVIFHQNLSLDNDEKVLFLFPLDLHFVLSKLKVWIIAMIFHIVYVKRVVISYLVNGK